MYVEGIVDDDIFVQATASASLVGKRYAALETLCSHIVWRRISSSPLPRPWRRSGRLASKYLVTGYEFTFSEVNEERDFIPTWSGETASAWCESVHAD